MILKALMITKKFQNLALNDYENQMDSNYLSTLGNPNVGGIFRNRQSFSVKFFQGIMYQIPMSSE